MNNASTDIDSLRDWFRQIEGAIVAFSGGVDSALVLRVARECLGKKNVLACISDSPSLKRSDLQEAKDFCQRFDIELEIIHTEEIDDPAYASNPFNRCFACKSHLYQDLSQIQAKHPNFTVLNGTNTDDLGDYRPGLQAAANHTVRSPLSESGIDKTGVRQLAQALDLPNWDKPASPCLSSRIPYGSPVTREKLSQIESAEAVLLRYGARQARVRHFGETARIEVPENDIPLLDQNFETIAKTFQALGFAKTEIDREGLVSGKLNRALPNKK